MSDIAARSGSSSPAISFSSSRVSFRYSSAIEASLVGLDDRGVLSRLGVGGRVVAQDVQREGRVDRRRDVRVDQGHRSPLGQLLARERVQLLASQLLVFLALLFAHRRASL